MDTIGEVGWLSVVILLELLTVLLVLRLHGALWQSAISRNVLVWTTAPGVIVHELSHALTGVLFGHKITEVSLFNPRSDAAQLGYVSFRYDPGSSIQTIGVAVAAVAPLIVGIAGALYLSCHYFALSVAQLWSMDKVPDFTEVSHFALDAWGGAIQTATPIKMLAVYLSWAILIHCCPSNQDLKNTFQGLLLVLLCGVAGYLFVPGDTLIALNWLAGKGIAVLTIVIILLLPFFISSLFLLLVQACLSPPRA